jgi:hypothetical protein
MVMRIFVNHLPVFILLLTAFVTMATVVYAAHSFTNINAETYTTVTSQATLNGTHNVEMGTNGNISYNAALTGAGTGTVAAFQLAGYVVGDKITIDCDKTGTIKNVGGSSYGATTLSIAKAYVSNTAGVVGPGLGNACNNIGGGNSMVHTYTGVAANDRIYLDTQINATHVKVGGTYSANNNGTLFSVKATCKTSGPNQCTVASGITATTDVIIDFLTSLGISSTTNMNFGKSAFTGTPGAGDYIALGTNNTAVAAGNFSLQGGTLTSGQVTISNAENPVVIQVQCDNSIHLTNAANTHSINVTGVVVAKEGSTGTYAAGNACNGSGGAVATTLTYTSGTQDQFFFGGKLDGSTASGLANETYSSTNPGGTSMTVVVLYQ